FVWVIAASNASLALGIPQCAPVTWSIAILQEGTNGVGGSTASRGAGCDGAWPGFFASLPDHPSPPRWWPLPVPSFNLSLELVAGAVLLGGLLLIAGGRPSRSRLFPLDTRA
ncbi:MAG: hypothetical protein ACREQ5_32805, partial [Candidatus Dormibacteria bacterium]